jgi:biotin-[acetyl-CoA-carboxylase] ligase BirA-like protein
VARHLPEYRTIFYDAVDSTSTRAAADVDPQLPAAYVADRQTAGRGRRGKTWHDCGTGVTATFAFATSPLPPQVLSLVAGVLVRRALASFVEDVRIKWPNDLHRPGGKVAGLLCERVGGRDLIGVGVNVMPVDLEGSTGLGTNGDRLAVLHAIGRTLLSFPAIESWPSLRAELDRHDHLRGRDIRLDEGPVLPYEGVDADGRLCAGGRTFVNGTVRPA